MDVLPGNVIPRSPNSPIIEVNSSLFYIPNSLPSFMSLFLIGGNFQTSQLSFQGAWDLVFFR